MLLSAFGVHLDECAFECFFNGLVRTSGYAVSTELERPEWRVCDCVVFYWCPFFLRLILKIRCADLEMNVAIVWRILFSHAYKYNAERQLYC